MYRPIKTIARSLSNTFGIGLALAAIATPTLGRADVIDFSAGFQNTNNLIVNQASTYVAGWNPINNGQLVITTQQYFERSAVFFNTPVSVTSFKTSFDFQCIGNPGWMADGITFCIQNQGPNALGGPGGGMGFGPDPVVGSGPSISNSVAVKFDLYQNWPDPSDSCTGLFTNGVSPVGGTDLLQSNVDLRSNDRFHVDMSYNGTTLNVTLTDTVTQATATQSYTINIPATVGSQSAYVGFTGGTGGAVSNSSILAWYYNSAPLAPQLTGFTLSPNNLCGGLSTQGTVTLQQSMGADTQITLTGSNPNVALPASVVIPAGQTSVTFPIPTQVIAKATTFSLCASAGNSTQKATLLVCPIGLNTMGVSANYVGAGQPSTGTLTLQVPAAPGALTVQLSSNNPVVAGVPSSVVVPAGATSVTFPITTGAVSANTPVMITGSLNGTTRTTTLTVRPLRVNSVVSSAVKVSGGTSLTATVTLEAPATAGGVVLTLSSNSGSLQVPSSVTVAAGATSVTFPVTTSGVSSSTNATITASSPVNNVYSTVIVTP